MFYARYSCQLSQLEELIVPGSEPATFCKQLTTTSNVGFEPQRRETSHSERPLPIGHGRRQFDGFVNFNLKAIQKYIPKLTKDFLEHVYVIKLLKLTDSHYSTVLAYIKQSSGSSKSLLVQTFESKQLR